MGLFSRFRSKKTDTVPEKEETEKFIITFRCPPYFKQESGQYHVEIDGTDNVCEPLQSFSVELTKGTHSVKVYSTPETLDTLVQEIEVTKPTILSITVNVLKKSLKLADNNPNNH